MKKDNAKEVLRLNLRKQCMKIVINPYITFNKIDKEIIILSENGSRIFQLDPLSSENWSLLENGKEVSEIISELSANYNEDPKVIHNDIEKLINKFIKDNLLIEN